MTEISRPESDISPLPNVFQTIKFVDPNDANWRGGGYIVSASQCEVMTDATFASGGGYFAVNYLAETLGATTGNIPPKADKYSYNPMLVVEPAQDLTDGSGKRHIDLYTVDSADYSEKFMQHFSVSQAGGEGGPWDIIRERLKGRSRISLTQGSTVTLLWVSGMPIEEQRNKPQNAVPNFAKDTFLNMWDIKRAQKLTPLKALGHLLVPHP